MIQRAKGREFLMLCCSYWGDGPLLFEREMLPNSSFRRCRRETTKKIWAGRETYSTTLGWMAQSRLGQKMGKRSGT